LASRDERTPWYAKFLAGVVVAYAFSPIDLIPDFVPVIGLLDDMLLIPLGVVIVRRLVPAAVIDDCRLRAECAFDQHKPVNWLAAGVIVVLWIVMLCVFCRAAWVLS
jgi:uncharacterized membrane protein YkvA (DUF1232 family)